MILTSEATAAIATIFAAGIPSLISFTIFTLAKEQKTSEFRQAWIDGLRNDITTFLATTRAIARAMSARNTHGIDTSDPFKTPFANEKIGELRYLAAESFNKIRLRLNQNNADHKELERLMNEAIKIQNQSIHDEEKDVTNVLNAIERVLDQSRPVLKKEWELVKKGEPQFTRAKWGIPIFIILLGGVVVWLLI